MEQGEGAGPGPSAQTPHPSPTPSSWRPSNATARCSSWARPGAWPNCHAQASCRRTTAPPSYLTRRENSEGFRGGGVALECGWPWVPGRPPGVAAGRGRCLGPAAHPPPNPPPSHPQADQLLAPQFREEVVRLAEHCGRRVPGGRQTVLVSATMTQKVATQYARWCPDPIYVSPTPTRPAEMAGPGTGAREAPASAPQLGGAPLSPEWGWGPELGGGFRRDAGERKRVGVEGGGREGRGWRCRHRCRGRSRGSCHSRFAGGRRPAPRQRWR